MTSVLTATINGTTITDRRRPAASIPMPSGGPLKSGRNPSADFRTGASVGGTQGTSTKMPHRPMTTLGMAASRSTKKPTRVGSHPGQESEEEKDTPTPDR